MKTYPNLNKQPGQPPRFEETYGDILMTVPVGGAVRVLEPLEYYTHRQRAWYRGICLPGLSQWNGDTVSKWDERLKKECHGKDLLKVEYWELKGGEMLARLTIKKVGKKKMTQFIQEILDYARENQLPIVAPDPDLRGKKKMQNHTKIYMEHFGYGEQDIPLCEVCSALAVDPHHIVFKSQGGTDDIENLIGLCRSCHDRAHGKCSSGMLTRETLQEIVENR